MHLSKCACLFFSAMFFRNSDGFTEVFSTSDLGTAHFWGRLFIAVRAIVLPVDVLVAFKLVFRKESGCCWVALCFDQNRRRSQEDQMGTIFGKLVRRWDLGMLTVTEYP